MGIKFDHNKCNGCGGCVAVCPGDLLALDEAAKSYSRNQDDCWDCMACVKACTQGALETELPFSLADYGASLKPRLDEHSITWVCTYPDGRREEFILARG